MRRTLLRLLTPGIVAALAIGVAACGGDDGSQAKAEDAERGGALTVLAQGDVDFIDPGAAYYQFAYMIHFATQRPLYSWAPDETETPTPDLAEGEPDISDGGRTLTVTLREGVRFSPPVNREVTSADVKYAIERGLLPGVANGYEQAYFGALEGFDDAVKAAEENAKEAPDIGGIETPDERTIVLRLTEPVAAVVSQALSLPLSAPVPEEYAKEFDAKTPSEYGEHQVATGPYMIENDPSGKVTGYSAGKEIKLVRNQNWDEGTDYRPAYLDTITVKEGFSDAAAASRQILQGRALVNGDFPPPPNVLKQAVQRFEDQLETVPSGGNRYISLNTTVEPFDDVNVRRAVLAAADREALRLTRGGELIGDIATHFIPPEMPGFEEAGGKEGPELDFLADPNGDLELAAEYMRKAGFASGKYEGDAELLMVGDDSGVGRKTAEVALQTFEKLGFEVDFRPVTHDTMYTKFCNRTAADVAICPNVGWLKDFNDPQTILGPTFDGDNIQPVNNSNWPELDVPEINAAMDEATLINDPDERAEAWGEIDEMVTAQAPAIPWIWDNQVNIRSKDVNGVINAFNATWDLTHTSLK